MNKIETMKRKEIVENLKYVEKIAIKVQAIRHHSKRLK